MNFYPAANEYARNEELKREDVTALADWLAKQPHLPQLTELDLILFLHSCEYSNELAKKTIDNFYTSRTLCPEFFASRDPRDAEQFKHVNKLLYAPLDKRTPEKYRIVFVSFLTSDPDDFQMAQAIKGFDMVNTLTLHQQGTAPGLVIVVDAAKLSFGHVAKFNLLQLKKFFFYLQEGMPVRLKAFHFINSPTYIDVILNMIKPLLKKELLEAFHVHTGDNASLYEHVPKECLPKDLDGGSPTVEELLEKQRRLYLDNLDYFLGEEKLLVDESKRPGKPKTASDLFGVEGTFKALSID